VPDGKTLFYYVKHAAFRRKNFLQLSTRECCIHVMQSLRCY